MKARALPPYEALQELLHYDPETGTLTWKQSRGRVKAGQVAGARAHRDYRQIKVLGQVCLAHRIAWKLQTGKDPAPGLVIDHVNGIRSDNRWLNLRIVSQSINVGCQAHRPGLLPRGVSFDKRRGTYGASVGRPPARRTKSGLTLEQATALAQKWRQNLYPGSLEQLRPRSCGLFPAN